MGGAGLSLYGRLARKAAELRLPRDWPARFFQRAACSPKPDAPLHAAPVGIGRCSQWRVPVGCVDIVPQGSGPGRLDPGPGPKTRECFE